MGNFSFNINIDPGSFENGSAAKAAADAIKDAVHNMADPTRDSREASTTVTPTDDVTVLLDNAVGPSDAGVEGLPPPSGVPVLLGYIVEKQRRAIESSGQFVTARLLSWVDCPPIYIRVAAFAGWRDKNVAYGVEYRYRVRSVWKCVLEREGAYGEEYVALKNRLIQYLPQCQAAIDMFVTPTKTAYYKSNSTDWVYAKILDVVPPSPTDILVRPNSSKKQILVTWLSPPDSQRDTNNFIVWRRIRPLREALMGLLRNTIKWNKVYTSVDSTDNFFIDKDVNFNNDYLYAVQVIDKHGLKSRLSAQVYAKLNKSFFYDGYEIEPRLWKYPGNEIQDDGTEIENREPLNRSVLFCRNGFLIKPKEQIAESEKKFYIRVTSIDTGEQKVIPLILRNEPLFLEEPEE